MRAVLVVIGVALFLAPMAHAKGAIQVCGPKACNVLADERTPPTWLFGGAPAASVYAYPAPTSYYVVRFADMREPLAYWIPSRQMLKVVSEAGVGSWFGVSDGDQAGLRNVTNGVDPFAAPTRAQVFVNGDNVKGAATYLRLFSIGASVTPPTRVGWLPIWIGGVNSPWTDNRIDFRVSKTGPYLFRNGLVFRIPDATAKKIRARQPLG